MSDREPRFVDGLLHSLRNSCANVPTLLLYRMQNVSLLGKLEMCTRKNEDIKKSLPNSEFGDGDLHLRQVHKRHP